MEYRAIVRGVTPEVRAAFVGAVLEFEESRFIKSVYEGSGWADIPFAAKATTPHEPTEDIWCRLDAALRGKGLVLRRENGRSRSVALATYSLDGAA